MLDHFSRRMGIHTYDPTPTLPVSLASGSSSASTHLLVLTTYHTDFVLNDGNKSPVMIASVAIGIVNLSVRRTA